MSQKKLFHVLMLYIVQVYFLQCVALVCVGLLKNLPPLADSMEGDSNKTEHQNKMSTMQSLANKLGVSIPVASNNQAGKMYIMFMYSNIIPICRSSVTDVLQKLGNLNLLHRLLAHL